jgi:hypothetical protein
MLTLSYVPNATPIARLYSAGARVGADIALHEIGATGEYQASVPSGTPAGEYLVMFYDASTKLASGPLLWSGTAEITAATLPTMAAAEVWSNQRAQAEQLRKVAQLHGVGVALVVTETHRTAGDVVQTLTTDIDGNTTVSAA